jgi:hypothetical protein
LVEPPLSKDTHKKPITHLGPWIDPNAWFAGESKPWDETFMVPHGLTHPLNAVRWVFLEELLHDFFVLLLVNRTGGVTYPHRVELSSMVQQLYLHLLEVSYSLFLLHLQTLKPAVYIFLKIGRCWLMMGMGPAKVG